MSRKIFLFFDSFVNLQFFRRNEGAEGPALARRTSSAYERSGLVPPKGRSLHEKSPFALPSGEPFRPEPLRRLRTRRRRIITVNSMSKNLITRSCINKNGKQITVYRYK